MKILFVSNYDAWTKVSQGLMPSQHLFGMHELIEGYTSVNGQMRGTLIGGGIVDFQLVKESKLPRKLDQLLIALKIAMRSRKYDCIYCPIEHCVRYLGVLKRFGLLHTKLVVFIHHLPYNFLKYYDSDALIYFTKSLKECGVQANPALKHKSYVLTWGPELAWYMKKDTERCEAEGIIDNGKSGRDNVLLVTAAKELGIRVYSYVMDKKFGKQNVESDLDMLQRISGYAVIAIPAKKRELQKNVVCGLTSFMDAIALAKPVLISDNVCFADEVMKCNLGAVYKTGDIDSMKDAMTRLINDKRFYTACADAMRKYSESNNMQSYSQRISEILTDISKKN